MGMFQAVMLVFRGAHRIHVWYIYLHLLYHKIQPNVGKYTIHGSYGVYNYPGKCWLGDDLASGFGAIEGPYFQGRCLFVLGSLYPPNDSNKNPINFNPDETQT